MENFKNEVLANLPSLLEQHFSEMREKNPDLNIFFSDHYEYIKSSLEQYFSRLITAIFDHEHYEQHKKETGDFSFEVGINFINEVKFNIDADIILELNQNLYQHIFISVYELIEHRELEKDVRIQLTQRLHELIWTTSQGFLRGYVQSKNQEIDRLHEQKVSIMGQMAAGMAHEIRNPITSINGFIHLMREQNEQNRHDQQSWEHYLSICQSEMKSIEMLVSDFLLLAKKSQEDSVEAVNYDLNVIFQRIEPFCRFYALQKSITLTLEAPKGEIIALINPQYVEQVFLNVVKNAMDAVTDDGNVSLSCSLDASVNEWVIQCKDDGGGIPPDSLNKIFDPFYSTKENGTGLGLPICKNLVEDMQGKIHIFSEVGKGALVEIRLPASQSPEQKN